MATEFPDNPEVDLGFRNLVTENSVPEAPDNLRTRMELAVSSEPRISKDRSSHLWWSLRITIILFLSALGGLVSSIFLFEHAERPSVIKRWKRETYIVPRAAEALPLRAKLELGVDQSPCFRIDGDSS